MVTPVSLQPRERASVSPQFTLHPAKMPFYKGNLSCPTQWPWPEARQGEEPGRGLWQRALVWWQHQPPQAREEGSAGHVGCRMQPQGHAFLPWPSPEA